MNAVLGLVSTLFILAAVPPYVSDTMRGKTKPERMTWFIFSVLGLIAFFSQLLLGATWSLLFSGLDTAMSLLVLGLSLRYGVGGYTRLDIVALFVALTGLLVALYAAQPLLSLCGVILADISGVVLTVRKAYVAPNSETSKSWLLSGTAAVFGLLAVSHWTFGLLLYPAYLAISNYAVPAAQYLGRRTRLPKAS